LAAVEVDELGEANILAEFYVAGNAVVVVHR
jgi:hypothetical protein